MQNTRMQCSCHHTPEKGVQSTCDCPHKTSWLLLPCFCRGLYLRLLGQDQGLKQSPRCHNTLRTLHTIHTNTNTTTHARVKHASPGPVAHLIPILVHLPPPRASVPLQMASGPRSYCPEPATSTFPAAYTLVLQTAPAVPRVRHFLPVKLPPPEPPYPPHRASLHPPPSQITAPQAPHTAHCFGPCPCPCSCPCPSCRLDTALRMFCACEAAIQAVSRAMGLGMDMDGRPGLACACCAAAASPSSSSSLLRYDRPDRMRSGTGGGSLPAKVRVTWARHARRKANVRHERTRF